MSEVNLKATSEQTLLLLMTYDRLVIHVPKVQPAIASSYQAVTIAGKCVFHLCKF